MTVEELQKLHPNDPRVQSQGRINRSRNYIRYRMSRGHEIDANHPLLTDSERQCIQDYNHLSYRLTQTKCQFFSYFYDNCPKVGSTLKRKDHKVEVIAHVDSLDW